jgi:transcriptional regulator with XRE-family HTH domain
MKNAIHRPSQLGVALKRHREAARLTQRALAERAGIHYTSVAKIEAGLAQDAELTTLKKLAKALDCRVVDLSDAGEIAPIDSLLDEYLKSPWKDEDRPTKEEIASLRLLPGIVFVGMASTPKAIHYLLEAARASSEKPRK